MDAETGPAAPVLEEEQEEAKAEAAVEKKGNIRRAA